MATRRKRLIYAGLRKAGGVDSGKSSSSTISLSVSQEFSFVFSIVDGSEFSLEVGIYLLA